MSKIKIKIKIKKGISVAVVKIKQIQGNLVNEIIFMRIINHYIVT